jgi:hypothetical protein
MARPKRSAAQREQDLVTLAKLYLQGVTLTAIAQQMGLARQQISYDLKLIRTRWRESTVVDFNEATNRELERLDLIETENWASWRESKLPLETSTTERVQTAAGQTERARLQKRARPGDPRYMDAIRWCVDARIRVLGLAAPTTLMHTGLGGGPILTAMVEPDERLLAAEAAFLRALYGDEPEPAGPRGEPGHVGLIEGDYRSPNGGAHAV